MTDTKERVRILDAVVLSDDWFVLKKVIFEFRRRDGTWQRQNRETYDRGNGATILLHNPQTGNVLLTRQFRMPAFVNGHDGMLIETAGGVLDNASPEERIRAEVEEETGYRLQHVERVFEAFMSPGSVTEKLFFYVGECDESMRVHDGGGVVEEGEEIETVEIPFVEAPDD
jgi:nudix-type nucleoside diphosphatase (YffH/AdpP family)